MLLEDTTREEMQQRLGIECIRVTAPIIGKTTSEWKAFFPKTATETELHTSVKCSYYPIIYIYDEVYNIQMTIEQVKSKLATEYMKYTDKYQDKILAILRKQGKREMIDDIRNNKYTLSTVIASEVYFLTNLDIWILANAYKLPIILFHQKKLKNLIDSVNWLKLSSPPADKANSFYFIRVPTHPDSPADYLPKYNIIKPALKMSSPEIIKLFSNASSMSSIPIDIYFEKISYHVD